MERYPAWRAEDRLTEVFACALASLDELARWFVRTADAPAPASTTKFLIKTQLTRPGTTGRPDMAIEYDDETSRRKRLLLSEHKIDAELTELQTPQYADWADVHVVLVAPLKDIDRYGFDSSISWLDVGREMHRIGTEAAKDAAWRDIALAPDSPGRLRVLEETLDFIERQHVGVLLRPMTQDMIDTYERWPATSETVNALLQTIRDQLEKKYEPSPLKASPPASWWFSVEKHWPYLDQFATKWAEVVIDATDEWLAEDSIGKPSLHAGFGFLVPIGEIPKSMITPHGAIAAQLAAANASVGHNPTNRRHIICAGTLYLDELRQDTLAEQADAAVEWVEATIEAISRITEA